MSMSLGKLMGIPIRIHYTLWFVFLLIAWSLAYGYMPQEYPGLGAATYWGIGIISAVVLFASVLFHELSHSYIAKKNGLPIARITLFFFGGVSEMTEEPHDPSLEVRMAAAGPLMSFLIAGLLGALWYMGTLARAPLAAVAILRYGAIINIVLGIFNLLPAFPVDGGRILRGSIWKRTKDLYRSTVTATRVSEYLSFLMIGAGLVTLFFGNFVEGLWIIFLGWFIKSGAEQSLRQTLVGEVLSGVRVEDIMTKNVLTIPPDITVQELISDFFLVHRHGGYPVVENGHILGLVTMQCVRAIPKERRENVTVRTAMVPCERMVTVGPAISALDAMNIMARKNIGRLLVLEKGSLVGILTRGDLMRTVRVKQQLED
jgi:Zn-dependent protease/predicted transcriptional regulator